MNILFIVIPTIIATLSLVLAARVIYLSSSENKEKIDGVSMSSFDATKGIKKLIRYALEKEPDYIIGINRGGILVGAYVALAVGLPRKNFRRCWVIEKNNYEVDCSDLEKLEGNVMIVSSIVRSGKTINSTRVALREKFPRINQNAIALILAMDEKSLSGHRSIDYHALTTLNRNLKLPWDFEDSSIKSKSAKEKEDFQHTNEKEVQDLAVEAYLQLQP